MIHSDAVNDAVGSVPFPPTLTRNEGQSGCLIQDPNLVTLHGPSVISDDGHLMHVTDGETVDGFVKYERDLDLLAFGDLKRIFGSK